jgi:hypothetical protein
MKTTKDTHSLALDLLDYCAGDFPTTKQVAEWMKLRGLELTNQEKNQIFTLANQFLVNP